MCETISNYGFGFSNRAPVYGEAKQEIKASELNPGDIVTIKGRVTHEAKDGKSTWGLQALDGGDAACLWAEGKANWAIGMVEKAKKPVRFYKVLFTSRVNRAEEVSYDKYPSLENFKSTNPNCTPLQLLESTMEVRYV